MHDHHHDHPYRMTAEPPFRRRGRGRGRGFGPPGPPGSFFGHGPRAARGDMRAAILALLAEAPMHGYQIIQEITDRTEGVWTPSPGSVYPTLQQLEDEGLVTADTGGGKKVFSLTDAGRAANDARTGRPPWEEVGHDVDTAVIDLRDALGQVLGAVKQIARGGSPTQVAGAKRVLVDARKALYRLLAEDDA
jgi:DNA-binding PadR family transcriptional regulator